MGYSEQSSHHGVVIKERVWQLARAATTPRTPDDYLDLFAPLRKGADLRGRVVEVRKETADAATIVIRPGADWKAHVPGQYLRIGVDIDGTRHWRAYSLTHGPRSDGFISITVKAVPDGKVSPYLVHQVQPGTMLHLEPADGEFVMPDVPVDGHGGGKFLFVTAGSGITPVIGMLRNLYPSTDSGVLKLDRSKDYDITCVHVATSEPDSIFIQDLHALAEAGAIKLIARYDDVHGILDVNQLDELVPDIADRETFACGPGGLLDAIEQHHAAKGYPLFVERFRTNRVEAGEGGTVTFGVSDRVVEMDGATPILDAAEEAGILMKSGCRMGICYSCVVPLREGSVRDLRNGEITTAVEGETGDEGVRIQTCINAAAGPCKIDC